MHVVADVLSFSESDCCCEFFPVYEPLPSAITVPSVKHGSKRPKSLVLVALLVTRKSAAQEDCSRRD